MDGGVSKWLETGEECIFSLQTGKTCQVRTTDCLKRGQN